MQSLLLRLNGRHQTSGLFSLEVEVYSIIDSFQCAKPLLKPLGKKVDAEANEGPVSSRHQA
jgi:hypothetical protein